jgi:hypothetical protein
MKRNKKHKLAFEDNIYLRDWDEDGDDDESSDEREEDFSRPRSGGSGGSSNSSGGGCATILIPGIALVGFLVWIIL